MENQIVSSYTKRPLWFWIAVYVVIGAVVYGGIYYFFLAKKGGYQITTQYTNPETVMPTADPTVTAQQISGELVSIFLTPSGFVPKDLTIKAGAKVVWTNNSGVLANVSSAPHPTHTEYPALNLGNFPAGGALSLTFTKPGTYKYHNHLDSSQFGSITVQ